MSIIYQIYTHEILECSIRSSEKCVFYYRVVSWNMQYELFFIVITVSM